jgi:hypothetical protein
MRCWPSLIHNVAAFDPASLSPDGWWRPDFSAPWNPTAPSANGNLATLGTAPIAGTAVNGHIPANFPIAGTAGLQSVSASSNFIGTTNCTIIVFFKPGTGSTIETAWYSEQPVFTTDNGDLGMGFANDGVKAGNGAGGNTGAVPLAVGTWAMAALRVSGGRINLRVSQPSGTTDAVDVTAAGASIDSFIRLGRPWGGGIVNFQGDIAEVLTWKSLALTNANLVSMVTYFNVQFAQGLT